MGVCVVAYRSVCWHRDVGVGIETCGVGPFGSGCIHMGVFAFRRLICALEEMFDMWIGGYGWCRAIE